MDGQEARDDSFCHNQDNDYINISIFMVWKDGRSLMIFLTGALGQRAKAARKYVRFVQVRLQWEGTAGGT